MAFIFCPGKWVFLTYQEQNTPCFIIINRLIQMKNQSRLAAPSGASASRPAIYQELGAYLETLRHTCLVEGRRISIRRLSGMAGMSNDTYMNVKRALPRTSCTITVSSAFSFRPLRAKCNATV